MLSAKKLILSAINLACLIQGISGQLSNIPTPENNKNCPGVLHNDQSNGHSTAYCCIGGKLDLSTCQGWPICTGSTWSPKPLRCYTEIPFSATDYNSLVKSASSKYFQNPDATATVHSEPATDTESKTSTKASAKQTASKTSSETSSPNTNSEETASDTASETTSETSSGASSTETGSDSNMNTPGSVGGLLGGILAMWIVL